MSFRFPEKLCTCKCHVSQNECCVNCYYITGQVVSSKYPNNYQETVTIKKVLWDEMLESKIILDEAKIVIKDMAQVISDIEKSIRTMDDRIDELFRYKNYQIEENRKVSRILDELAKFQDPKNY